MSPTDVSSSHLRDQGPGRSTLSPRQVLTSRLRLPTLLLVAVLAYGTSGYVVLAHYGVLDALFMTVITVSTVGYGEVHRLNSTGEVFTITVIVFGVVVVFAWLGTVTATLASGELVRGMRMRDMQKRIDKISGHYVVCAYGRVGRAAASELTRAGAQVVVVEPKAELEPLLIESGLPYLIDDAVNDSALEAAGIRRAKGLICAVDSDAANVYITLGARELNPDLVIISRASSRASIDKLMRAGSDRVVLPYSVSGVRMASLALRPAVLEFVDMVSEAGGMRIEELVLAENSPIAGMTVQQACTPYPGLMVLAVRSAGTDNFRQVEAGTRLGVGDLIIALGPPDSLLGMAAAAAPSQQSSQ